MRLLAFGSTVLAALLGLASGCGQSDGDSASPGGAGNSAMTAGSNSAGNAGTSATAGAASGGSSSGGSAAGGASSGGVTTGGRPDAQAGAGNEGGTVSGLVDCDPKKIVCKRVAPECDAGEVPSVAGSCYGDCVKVDQCACTSAEQCPQPNEYTCWAKQHCGPFVE